MRPNDRRTLRCRASDLELLLVNWLDELLYEFEVASTVFCNAEVEFDERPGDVRLSAICFGETYSAGRHGLKISVKGVTYHDLALAGVNGSWKARVIFAI